MAKSTLHQQQSNSSPHSSSPASSGGTSPTSKANASPGDRWRREIHPRSCLYLRGGCRLGPVSRRRWGVEAGGRQPCPALPTLGLSASSYSETTVLGVQVCFWCWTRPLLRWSYTSRASYLNPKSRFCCMWHHLAATDSSLC